MAILLLLAGLCGCGRIGYDDPGVASPPRDGSPPLADGGFGGGDAPSDAAPTDGSPTGSIDRTGLVALYHFNEAAWSGAPGEVLDSSGRGNHGTAMNGATTVDGLLGRAADFHRGSPHTVDLGDAPDLEIDPPFTILMWVSVYSLASTSGGAYRVISKSDATGDQREWAVSIANADLLEIEASSDGTALSAVPIFAIGPGDIGRWMHAGIVVLADGSVQGYRDGLPSGAGSIAPTIFHGTAAAWIGRRNPSGRQTDARVDELAIFTRALDAAEIRAIADSQSAGSPSAEI